MNDDDLFVFADADCGWYPEMCAQFVSGSFPAIALITGTTRKVYKYEGDRESASELTDFIRRRGDGLGLVGNVFLIFNSILSGPFLALLTYVTFLVPAHLLLDVTCSSRRRKAWKGPLRKTLLDASGL